MKGVKMKLYSKEALLLGGLYTVLAIPFTYLNESISGILLLLFIGLAITLCFKKKLRFLERMISGYPKISNCLSSIGWYPYIFIIFTVSFTASGYFFDYQDDSIEKVLSIFDYGTSILLVISLVYAIYKNFKKQS